MNIIIAFKYLTSIILSKKSYLTVSVLSAFTVNWVLNKLYNYINTEALTVPLVALVSLMSIASFFILADLITGVVASRNEGHRIQSSKWGVTVSKFLGLFLYFVLSIFVIMVMSSSFLALSLVFVPVILATIKEYISIGENLERRFEKKIYMFHVVERIFSFLEKKFFRTIEKNLKDSCDSEEENQK